MMCMSIRLSLVIYGIAIFQAVFFYFCMKHTRRLMHENLERQEVTYTYLLEVLKIYYLLKAQILVLILLISGGKFFRNR